MNLYSYPADPVQQVDPLGLAAKCPSSPPKNNNDWRKYVGELSIFHCRFDGYLENRDLTPSEPISECFYDINGEIVSKVAPAALESLKFFIKSKCNKISEEHKKILINIDQLVFSFLLYKKWLS